MSQRLDAAWLGRHPLPDPLSTESKEERGRVLVIGGSATVPGAAWLAGRGCLHAGAGKLQIGISRAAAIALAARLPEAMVLPLASDAQGEITRLSPAALKALRSADATLIGPGMADSASTRALVGRALGVATSACVLDAGAIGGWKAIAKSRASCIVTPHAGEMAAATGLTREEVEAAPLRIAMEFATAAACWVVMKGVPTHVVDPGGNALEHHVVAPGLGTSGSGDVLAGVLAGLLARGAEPWVAAAWGVWLHGEAGRMLGERVGPVGYLARDISPEVPGLMHARSSASAPRPRAAAGRLAP